MGGWPPDEKESDEQKRSLLSKKRSPVFEKWQLTHGDDYKRLPVFPGKIGSAAPVEGSHIFSEQGPAESKSGPVSVSRLAWVSRTVLWVCGIYRVAQKWQFFLVRLNFIKYWPIFKNYFTVRIRRKCVIILSLKIPPHLKYVATLPRYTTLWYVKCLQSNNWKQDDFCNNTFLKINDGNKVFIVSVIV